MKRLRNSTDIPDADVRQIVNWIAQELGIVSFDVELRNSEHAYAGRAYTHGSHYHTTRRPFVVIRVGTETIERWQCVLPLTGKKVIALRRGHLAKRSVEPERVTRRRFPVVLKTYQYGHLKGKRYWLASRIEALVYVMAHELRHLWQAASASDRRKSKPLPRYHGSRGVFSEIDTESFAIHMLRQWRKGLVL